MRYCLRCCYPENTKPGIIFDEKGICSGCRTSEQPKNIETDWNARKEELKELLDGYKDLAKKNDTGYDCIIPISGGKDSHYQAHLMTKVFKMNPLFVTYNHGYNSKIGMRNLRNIVDKFGCDLIRFSTNPQTARKISRYMLKKVGDITWHYHAGIMTFPIQIAVKYKIPLMIWGEHGEAFLFGMHNLDDKVEFTKKRRQEHLMRGFEPDDVLNDSENTGITKKDLVPFYYPSDEEIESVRVRGIYLANYIPWNQHENTEFLIKEYGFTTYQERQTTFNLYEKIDDFFQDTHNYLKYLKFGYSRCTDHSSLEIRNQRITREEGIELIRKHEHMVRPKNLDVFLKFAEITEEEFLDNINHLRDPNVWKRNSSDKWEITDWIGNHILDEGVEEARLPLKEKLDQVKSEKLPINEKDDPYDDEELIFL
jgi:N-acetyl sugar amidotransferase